MYQKASLNALFGLFFEANGDPLPEQTQAWFVRELSRTVKSASSLSWFVNHSFPMQRQSSPNHLQVLLLSKIFANGSI